MWPNYEFTVPESKRVRYIIHSDAKNEADDQFTIAHALMTGLLDVRGIIAAHFSRFGDARFGAGMTPRASMDEIEKILELMGLEGRFPLALGAAGPLPDEKTPAVSEGAEMIIREAMREDARPLFIGLQGSLTDLASAILMEPRVCSRMTAVWVGGGKYPEGGLEFNAVQDVNAVNVVFASDMPLWQIPSDVYKTFTVSLAELQYRVGRYGRIGRYLLSQMDELNDLKKGRPLWPHGETWNLGDEGAIAPLLEDWEKTEQYVMTDPPRMEPETCRYLPGNGGRKIRVYRELNSRLVLEDLFCKLAINFPGRDS